MKKIIFLFISSFILLILFLLLSSCDKATFQLENEKQVKVSQLGFSFENVPDSQEVWLTRGYGIHNSGWKILDYSVVDDIGFRPKKDTTLIIRTYIGNHKRRIALGTLIKE